MEFITNQEKDAVTKLLLSPSFPNVQLALEFLTNNPTWHSSLKEALEVFFFFDPRRKNRVNSYQNTPVAYQQQTPLIPFMTKDGSLKDAHELVGEWLGALNKDFYTLTHPLFYLGSPASLFQENIGSKKEPNLPLPSLNFLEQQLQYAPYLEFQPNWLVIAKEWGVFIVQHLDQQETSTLHASKDIEHYQEIAWHYYQSALPHVQEDSAFFAQVAYLLDKHAPTSLSEAKRLSLISYYYDQAFSIQSNQQQDCVPLLENYLLFCYETLQDTQQTITLFKRFLGDFIPQDQWYHLVADCEQLGNSDALRSWFPLLGLKASAASMDKMNNSLGIAPTTTPLTKEEQEQGFTSLGDISL
ncbi:MAG: hypothetical protein ACRBFS_02610 [Aureispira sp.]